MRKDVTLDCETTGLPPKKADYKVDFMNYPYVVTFAYKINDDVTQEFIINQEGRPIPPEATAIHGITDEMAAASKHTLFDVLTRFMEESKNCHYTVGHNIFFDTSTIKANVLRLIQLEGATPDFFAQLEELLSKERRICTMFSTIKFCGLNGKWPKLTELHQKLFGCAFDGAHTSGGDVDATRKCFLELVKMGIIILTPIPEAESATT